MSDLLTTLLLGVLVLLIVAIVELRKVSAILQHIIDNPVRIDYSGPWTLDTATTASSGEGGGDAVR